MRRILILVNTDRHPKNELFIMFSNLLREKQLALVPATLGWRLNKVILELGFTLFTYVGGVFVLLNTRVYLCHYFLCVSPSQKADLLAGNSGWMDTQEEEWRRCCCLY